MGTVPDPYALIGQHWPTDGPHDPDRLATAMVAVAELVRYANHATRSTRSAALPSAPEVYPAVTSLAAALAGLEQLTRQLAGWAQWLTQDPTLRHAALRGDPAAASALVAGATADAAAGHLARHGDAAVKLAEQVHAAGEQIGHLYHADPAGEVCPDA